MSFLMKKPDITPGFAIYRPNANATGTYFFQEGTFQALEGGTNTLIWEGGYRYFIEMDWGSSNTTTAVLVISAGGNKYYGGAGFADNMYSRAYSVNNDQKWLSSFVVDAHSDITTTLAYGAYQSPNTTISVWRFPL